jgi:cobalt-zinc-cadmium efflux system membrane fusion protein
MNSPVSTSTRSWLAVSRWLNGFIALAAVVIGLLLLVALRLEWISVLPPAEHQDSPSALPPAAQPAASVRLPPEKLASADLQLATAERRSIQPTRSVPGVIIYDAARRLVVTAPTACVVVDVLVEPGQQAAAGQPLAVLSSAEVGLARDEALRREAELSLARQQQAWAEGVADNVEQLLSLLTQKPALADVEKSFSGKVLGDYREKIVAAYSKLLLAESSVGGTESLEQAGALTRRFVDERRSDREVAAAQLAAACEMAKFSAAQERQKARAASEQAERLLAVARQSLRRLLGAAAGMTPVSDGDKLSELALLTPMAGRIEERRAVAAARVAAGEPLFIVADTSVLWVSAEIHERDWPALAVAQDGQLAVRLPALNDEELAAKVRFIGARVDPHTRSVPLVAELTNEHSRLKPGMFAWVEVPLAQPREVLVVPAGAIMRHENQPFVFVPAGPDEFRRVDVAVGLETRGGVEILAGLESGQQVVDRGAFYLKSELLLERDEE